MTNLQLTIFVLALWCIRASVLGGLLAEGANNGYQYNRPSSVTFGLKSEEDSGRRNYIGESSDRFATTPANTYDYGARNAAPYALPAYSGFANANSLTARSSGGYDSLNGFNGIGNYPGGGGDVPSGFSGFSDSFRNRYNRDNKRPRPYSFQYAVRDPPSGNDYGQQESSDGDVVQGEYRVLLPDSRTQIVKYVADDVNGYTADVQYEGQAQFPRSNSGIGVGITAQGYQFPDAPETPYQSGFGLSHYQGRGGYNGPNGVVAGYSFGGNGMFTNGGVSVADPRGQYLPPTRSGYGK